MAGAVVAGLVLAGAVGLVAGDLIPRFEGSVPEQIARIESLAEGIPFSNSQSSVVLAADGSVLGRFQPEDFHVPLASDELPESLQIAVVAAEDQRFWEHRGFDGSAIVRAALANFAAGGVAQGGSTITQQLVKNLFTDGDRTLERKLRELQGAVAIEERFTKTEILTAYLNSTYFGGQAFGVEAAAQTFLRKSARDLTLGEAALLVAVIPAPSAYSPRSAPEAAERQRQSVLDRVEAMGVVEPAELSKAREQIPEVFPARPAVERHAFFLDYVRVYLLEVAGIDPELLYGGGLEIRTTLDPRIQEATEAAVSEALTGAEGPTAAAVVLAPETGHVLALVGGKEWQDSEVNLALGRLGAGSGRQPGSSFKAFVLAAAFEQGWSPDDVVDAPQEYLPRTVVDPQPVLNYTRRGYGSMTLGAATVSSVNTAFVGLAETIGSASVAEVAARLGIDSLPPPDAVGPSIAIGAYETSPLEMAAAYGGFATDGRRVHPTPVAAIVGESGAPLDVLPAAGAGEQVVEVDTARLVTATLTRVVTEGTAVAARIGRPLAAKTGTSDNHENAWLVGYTPQLAAAVWVGHPEGNVAMTDVAGVARVTGGTIPAQIFSRVMAAAHEGLPVQAFPPAPRRVAGGRDGGPVGDAEVAPGSAEDQGRQPEPASPGQAPPGQVPPGQVKPEEPATTRDIGSEARETARARVCERVPNASICG